MSLPNTTILIADASASDNNSGTFNPGNANFLADGVIAGGTGATPTFSSASYTFVAGDVGAWVFLKSGTSVTPCWAQITAVNAGAATLDGVIGHCPLYINGGIVGLNTVLGVATIAAPNTITFGVDYSRGTTTAAITALTSNASTTISGTGITRAMIGNGIRITGAGAGGIYTVGNQYELVTVPSVGNATTDVATNASANTTGTANVGGAVQTIGRAGFVASGLTGIDVYIKGAQTYSISVNTSNVAGGFFTGAGGVDTTNQQHFEGFSTYTGDKCRFVAANRPLIQISAALAAGMTAVIMSGNSLVDSVIVDGNSNATSTGISCTSVSGGKVIRSVVTGCTTSGINHTQTACSVEQVEAVSNTGNGIKSAGKVMYCDSHSNGIGFLALSGGFFGFCNAWSNTSDGFSATAITSAAFDHCSSSSNTRYGFDLTGATISTMVNFCIAYGNATDWKEDGVKDGVYGTYNAGTWVTQTNFPNLDNKITLSALPWTSASVLTLTPAAQAILSNITFTYPTGGINSYQSLGSAPPQGGVSGALFWSVATPKGRGAP